MPKYYRIVCCFFLLLSLHSLAVGQSWERSYPSPLGSSWVLDVLPTADGGFLLAGNIKPAPGNNSQRNLRLVKTDAEGQVQWDRVYKESLTSYSSFTGFAVAADGHYLVCGAWSERQAFVMKIDDFGDLLWQRFYDPLPYSFSSILVGTSGFVETSDGSYIFGINTIANDDPHDDYALPTYTKIDEEGNILWQRGNQPGEYVHSNEFIDQLLPLDDGGVLGTVNIANEAIGLIQFNTSGEVAFSQGYYTIGQTSPSYAVTRGHDGGYILIHNEYTGQLATRKLMVTRINDAGNVISSMILPIEGNKINAIQPIETGGYLLAGKGYYAQINEAGGVDWVRRFPITESVELYQAYPIGDAGFLLTGIKNGHMYLAKIDGLSPSQQHVVRGRVFETTNCGAGDDLGPKANWFVRIESQSHTAYTTTDAEGGYELYADPGTTYALQVFPSGPLWNSCAGVQNIVAPTPEDTTNRDFPFWGIEACPSLEIDIATPLLRRCFQSKYTINYCNAGTGPAYDAYVEVTLDPYLEFLGASILNTSLGANRYAFAVGDIDANTCGNFTFDVHVDCDSTVLGQTHCVEAHIFPDTLCLPVADNTALIDVGVECVDDETVRFTLRNAGAVDMNQLNTFIVIEDDVMYLQNPFIIESGDSIIVTYPANGATYRLETALFPDVPNGQFVSAVVEGCGLNDDGSISTGYVNQFSQYEDGPWLDINCTENIGSFDPNDKSAIPKGYGEAHAIRPNAPLEYLIRFQNTGTDTAFTVVVRDTLSPGLDPLTFKPGAASHLYRYKLSGGGIVTFYFDDIRLPDSTRNEPASHGFVQFSIAQKPDNAIGTVIENSAAIYFDFNAPVITNVVSHTVAVNFIQVVETPIRVNTLRVFPNPSSGSVSVRLEEKPPVTGLHTVLVHDLFGNRMHRKSFLGSQAEVDLSLLPKGLYLLHVLDEQGKSTGYTRIVVQ